MCVERNTGESTTACGGAISNVKSVMECQQGIKRDIDSSLSTHKTELSNIDQKHNEAKKVRLTSTEQMRTEAINATQTQQDGIMTNLESQSEFYTKVEQMVSSSSRRTSYNIPFTHKLVCFRSLRSKVPSSPSSVQISTLPSNKTPRLSRN